MQPTRLERDAQRLAGAEQLRLADHVVERLRAQALGQRRRGIGVAERQGKRGVGHAGTIPPGRRPKSTRARRRTAAPHGWPAEGSSARLASRSAGASGHLRSLQMDATTYDAVAAVLADQFKVDRERIAPDAALESLGLDSLALMEFVFAVEDRFDVRIPQDRLDPRQAGITLATIAALLDEAVAAKSASQAADSDDAPGLGASSS